MFDAFKRLLSGRPARPAWQVVSDWAASHRLTFKREHEGEGFVIDGGVDSKPWRLEWGPSQRLYIEGRELRLRMELGLPPSLQLLLMAQPLLETLEGQMFERFTESTQTVIEGATPEEMRWLAMFPKVPYQADKALRMRFGLVGSPALAAAAWVEGALVRQLQQASAGFLKHEPPFLMMVLRGRVYLRMLLPAPDVELIAQAVALFETAVVQALRVSGSSPDTGEEWPTTASSSAWHTQLDPDMPKRGPR